MSIRTFNGNWIIAGAGIATSDDCCCDSSCASDADCPSGQHCCDGVCQEEPCDDCSCPNKCGYELKTTYAELSTTAEAVVTPADCDSCGASEEDVVANPQDPGDQVATGGTNFVQAIARNDSGFGLYADGFAQFTEAYEYMDGDERRDYNRSGSGFVVVYCSFADGVAKWRVDVSKGYAEGEQVFDTSTSPFTVLRQRSSGVTRFASIEVALESCCFPPDITVVWDLDEVTINGTSYPMTDASPLQEFCQDFIDGTPVPCSDYLADYPAPITFEMTWTGDCDGPCDAPPP